MKIVSRGILNRGPEKSPRAVATFPSVTRLHDGVLLSSYRVGSTKDSADGTIELRRSEDSGTTWSEPISPFATTCGGRCGSLWLAYATPLLGEHILLAAMWVDRAAFPGCPLFNRETEGCLPIKLLLADSHDNGQRWGNWRELPVPQEIGPPSLTNPILRLSNGRLAVSIESNKAYQDTSKWRQRVVYCFSDDNGTSWTAPHVVTEDPEGRICNWDQRAGVSPEGLLASFTWTYDRRTSAYRNIQRRLSADQGQSWTPPEDLGFADQAGRPAVLADGRVVLPWVDRFQSGSIRARLAANVSAAFPPSTEIVLYDSAMAEQSIAGTEPRNTGRLLEEMGEWKYGLPYAEAVAENEVLVVHYARSNEGTQIVWVRIEI